MLLSRSFKQLYLSSIVSAAGSAVSLVSILWLVYSNTKNPLAVGFVGLGGTVPGIAIGLFAGVIADRYDRRLIMIISDVIRAAVVAILAISLYYLGFDLIIVLAAVITVNAFTALFLPASEAILPKLVETSDLVKANGLVTASAQLAQMTGSATGGAVILFFGPISGLAFNVLTFILSATFLIQIPSSFGLLGHPEKAPFSPTSLSRDLVSGLGYMRRNKPVLEVTLGFLPANFLLVMVTSFTVIYIQTYFPGTPADYGYLVAAMGGGVALGALFVGRTKLRRFAGPLMALAVLAEGGLILGLATSHLFVLSLALGGLMGFGVGLINTIYTATMQAIVPNALLGRVLSIDLVGSFLGIPLGLVTGGLIASAYGIGMSFSVAGLGLLTNGLVMILLPDLRRFGAETFR